MLKPLAFSALALALTACATAPPPQAGFLTSYDGLEKKPDTLRVAVSRRADKDALARLRRVAIKPAVFAPYRDIGWLTEDERTMLLREVDAQLCFEVSETYDLVPLDQAEASVRTAITDVRPTGRAGSAASAAAGFFIPGPIGLRPGGTGGITVESEIVDRGGRQLAALTWSRKANVIGMDNPSLSRVGDAMQFVEPFGDDAGKTFRPQDAKARAIPADADPCKAFGPRFRVEGFAAKVATGLYVPRLSGASRRDTDAAVAAAPDQAADTAASAPRADLPAPAQP